jgi:hypothetical protein
VRREVNIPKPRGGRLTAPSREVTEAKLNGFAATVTAARFDTDAY